MRAIRASFESRCGYCHGRIYEDEPIVNVDDEWVHAQCAENEGEEVER